MATEKKDILNIFFTNVLNNLLNQVGLEEIQPNELKSVSMYSTYQGTNRPETVLFIDCKNKMLSFDFKKGKLTTSNWRHFKE